TKPDVTGAKPVTPNGTDTTKINTPTSQVPGGPVVINPTDTKTEPKVAPAPSKTEERMVGTYERLEETFNTVWKQPVLTSEVGELMAEYQRAADKAASKPELQKQLQARVDDLKL